MSTAEKLAAAHYIIDAVFLYAACTEDGYVKIGISRKPFDRVSDVHSNSPSPIRAVQWAWVGSIRLGRKMESEVRKAWKERHTRGEWYWFDYSLPGEKRAFHDTLNAVFAGVTKHPPEWKRMGPKDVKAMLDEVRQKSGFDFARGY